MEGENSGDFQFDNAPPEKPDMSNFWQWALETEGSVEVLKHTFRGEVYNYDDKKWIVPKTAKPLMNEVGINELILFLSALYDRRNVLSYMKEKEILRHAKWTFQTIAFMMRDNYNIWGLKFEKLDYIFTICEQTLYMGVYKRALDGKTLRAISENVQRIEQVRQAETQGQERKILPKIFN